MSVRGTRWTLSSLPDGWLEIGHAARKAAKLPRINLQLEAAKFIDYWTAACGVRASKLDWLATWRNWCRSAYNTQPEAEPDQPAQCNCEQDQALRRAALAAKGIRSALLSRQDLELGVSQGVIDLAQAKRMGL